MNASPFLEVLKYEVGRMQAAHPEREGEIARAHALILQGMVVPTEDVATAHVLSSDGTRHYEVNGSCNCSAGHHGKACKHLHAWKLYQYIARKVAAQTAPAGLTSSDTAPQPLPEAPASANVRVQIGGREVQWTLRDRDEGRLAARLERLLAQYPAQAPAQPASQGEGWCRKHGVQMKETTKDGRSWLSHYDQAAGKWCKGRG
jgi:hypothetical protein